MACNRLPTWREPHLGVDVEESKALGMWTLRSAQSHHDGDPLGNVWIDGRRVGEGNVVRASHPERIVWRSASKLRAQGPAGERVSVTLRIAH